jgi:hypothetical protein
MIPAWLQVILALIGLCLLLQLGEAHSSYIDSLKRAGKTTAEIRSIEKKAILWIIIAMAILILMLSDYFTRLYGGLKA